MSWRVLGLLVLFCLPGRVLAGPNAGGVLVAHDAGLAYTTDLSTYCGTGLTPDSCSMIDAELDGSDADHPRVWKVYAIFPDGDSPRLKGIAFGVHHSPTALVITAFGPCVGDMNNGAAEYQGVGWPADRTGTALVFQNRQSAHVSECYWFAGYQYSFSDSTLFEVTANPDSTLGGNFGDDSVPPQLDPIADYGRLGFGRAGYAPCPIQGQQGPLHDDWIPSVVQYGTVKLGSR